MTVTMREPAVQPVGVRLAGIVQAADALVRRIATPSLAQFVLRLGLATPFFRSGILKWDGFLQLNATAIYLFSDEFKLHLPGGPYAFPAPEVFAFLSGCAEVGLPVLLVLGLGTRFAAFGLLVMTIIIELTAPEAWPVHITWAAMEFGIMAGGAGAIALDHLIARRVPAHWSNSRKSRNRLSVRNCDEPMS